MTEANLFVDTTLLPNFYRKVFVNTGEHSIQRILHVVILEPDKALPLSIKRQNPKCLEAYIETNFSVPFMCSGLSLQLYCNFECSFTWQK